MSKVRFQDIVKQKDGFLRGPFGGDLKKDIFVEKSCDTYKVYEQGVVLNNDESIGRYYISNDYFKKKMYRFEVKPKDFLVSCSGVNYGAIHQLSENIEKGVINQALLRIRLDSEKVDDNYFYYLFKALIVNMIVGKKGDSTIPNFPPLSVIKALEFELPEKDYQIQIGRLLSHLDNKIELNNRINAELEAMAKTLYDYWFVQFDFPDANGKPYKTSGGKMVYNSTLKREIPEGWEATPLSEVTPVSNQSVNPADYPDQVFRHYSIPVYDATKTYGLEAGDTIGSNKFTVEESDILVSKLNPWFSRVIYAMEEEDIICSTEFIVWRTPNDNVKNFLYMVATSPQFVAHCTQSATGTSNSHKRVNPGVMMRFEIPFKEEIASTLGEKLEPMIKQMVVNQRENTSLAKLRDWLLPMLMNGQVTVTSSTQSKAKEA